VELPENLTVTSQPHFHYRGWFVDDEDLLTGWRPGFRDGTGIRLDTWDHIFEALLRLKGNMVVPGTWIFPYEPQFQAAVDRGLVVTQHHVNVLAPDAYRWPKNRPYSFSTAPELLQSAMRRALNQYPSRSSSRGALKNG
jgi:Glycosyl hydrolase family 115